MSVVICKNISYCEVHLPRLCDKCQQQFKCQNYFFFLHQVGLLSLIQYLTFINFLFFIIFHFSFFQPFLLQLFSTVSCWSFFHILLTFHINLIVRVPVRNFYLFFNAFFHSSCVSYSFFFSFLPEECDFSAAFVSINIIRLTTWVLPIIMILDTKKKWKKNGRKKSFIVALVA